MKNRTRRHVTYKNDNRLFLLLELSPVLVFKFDFLSLLCNMNTLRNILMMLGTNVEQDEMTYCVLRTRMAGLGDIFSFFFSKKTFSRFSSFRSRRHPVATEQVSAQGDQMFGKRCRKLIFKMSVVTAILDFLSAHLTNLCLLSALMLITLSSFDSTGL